MPLAISKILFFIIEKKTSSGPFQVYKFKNGDGNVHLLRCITLAPGIFVLRDPFLVHSEVQVFPQILSESCQLACF